MLGDQTVGVVTWVGTVAGLIGVVVIYLETRRARTAASAAALAVQVLENRLSLADLSYAYSQLDSVRGLVQAGNVTAARSSFGSLKRIVLEILHLLAVRPELALKIEKARKTLRAIERQLDLGSQGSPKYTG